MAYINDKRNDKLSETDSFWNADSFLPMKKPRLHDNRTYDTNAVVVELPQDSDSDPAPQSEHIASDAGVHIPPRESINPVSADNVNTPIYEYESENPFIIRVRILPWPSRYSFYERFRRDAMRYFNRTGSPCEHVTFFSYMPQYVQLDANQRCWYFWWRDNSRRGNFLKCDMSYIMLYIYEIINLPDLIPSRMGLERLCELWLAYRGDYPRLDRYLCEWVCDYCLIHQLDPPFHKLESVIPDIMKYSTFKEFYIASGTSSGADARLIAMLIGFSSNYYYKNSKYITDENRLLFEKHINGAFLHTYRKLSQIDPRFNAAKNEAMKVRFTRDSFLGALCAYDVKRRIDIEYFAFSRSPELRIVTTDIIKCAENQLRAYLGIKSRLSCSNITDPIKAAVTEYFNENGLKRQRQRPVEQIPDYENLYEASSSSLSPEASLEIERKSWEVTELLSDAFTDEKTTEENDSTSNDVYDTSPIPEPDVPEIAQESVAGNTELEKQAFGLLLGGDENGFRALAERNNMLPDALAAQLNELSYDIVGDITLDIGEHITVIEDYTEEIREWMNR